MLSDLTYRWKKDIKYFLRKIKYSPISLRNLVLGMKKDLVPPDWKNHSGGGDFKSTGFEFFEFFKKFDLVRPDSKILDVGCGIGRMAIPLIEYLNNDGRYEGFDIMNDSIRWCKKNISKKFPNFQFKLENIYNKEYNPGGKYKGSEYIFPFTNKYFDFVYLTSVFTHMMPQDVEKYISQISRVLKPGGRSLITFFLLNQESLGLIEQGKSSIDFNFHFDIYRIKDNKIPEAAIAYDEIYIRNLYNQNNMKIIEPIHYGSFCGRKEYLSYQDIIIAEKLSI